MNAIEFARTKTATYQNLKDAIAYFKRNPDGIIKVDWCTSWTKTQLKEWLLRCINNKINQGDKRNYRKFAESWQDGIEGDSQRINEYFAKRIRHPGSRGLLRTPEMKAKYPYIDCQEKDW